MCPVFVRRALTGKKCMVHFRMYIFPVRSGLFSNGLVLASGRTRAMYYCCLLATKWCQEATQYALDLCTVMRTCVRK
jgi:hypothetical protein